jgi:hypothetical protein
MAGTTAARGGQAGGLVTVLSDGSTVFHFNLVDFCGLIRHVK